MLTVVLILALAALVLTIAAAMNRTPLWIPVLVLCVIALLESIPLR